MLSSCCSLSAEMCRAEDGLLRCFSFEGPKSCQCAIFACLSQTELGRDLQGQRWGPRPLDLDIIFYEGLQHREEGLEIPHPRWQERPFVQARVATLTPAH